jgi:hypothetical protein
MELEEEERTVFFKKNEVLNYVVLYEAMEKETLNMLNIKNGVQKH